MMKAIGYVRVSSDEQATEGISLEAQEAKVRAYCDLYGIELVEVIVDAGQSAKSLNRPGIQRALSLLKAKKADGIVVAKLDRLSRSTADWAALIERYFGEKAGRQLWSVGENIDTRSAAGRMVLNILMSVAQWEREAIGERTRAALQHKKSKGERVGPVPLGYDVAPDGVHLIPNQQEQEVLRLARQLRDDEWTLQAIADEFNRRGIVGKKGRTKWEHHAVRKLLMRTG